MKVVANIRKIVFANLKKSKGCKKKETIIIIFDYSKVLKQKSLVIYFCYWIGSMDYYRRTSKDVR